MSSLQAVQRLLSTRKGCTQIVGPALTSISHHCGRRRRRCRLPPAVQHGASMAATPQHGFRIRTVSLFCPNTFTSTEEWEPEVSRAAAFLKQAQQLFEEHGELPPLAPAARCTSATLSARLSHQRLSTAGYEVQTVRLVTRALSAAASAEHAAALAAGLEQLCLAAGIRFLSLGSTSDLRLLRGGVFAKIAAVTDYTSCSFRCGCWSAPASTLPAACPAAPRAHLPPNQRPRPLHPRPRSWQPGMGQREARALAAAIHGLEAGKPGATFRFGVSFNCERRCIPYFPAAAAGEGPEGAGFAIGTENSGLLHRAFQAAAAEVAAADGSGGSVLDAAQASLAREMTAALAPVEALAQQLAAAAGRPYRGIDASIAPALEPPSIPAAYELLGLGAFGGCGTLAISGGRAWAPACAGAAGGRKPSAAHSLGASPAAQSESRRLSSRCPFS